MKILYESIFLFRIISRQPSNEIDDDNCFIVSSFFDSFVLSTHAIEQWIDSLTQVWNLASHSRNLVNDKILVIVNHFHYSVQLSKAGKLGC